MKEKNLPPLPTSSRRASQSPIIKLKDKSTDFNKENIVPDSPHSKTLTALDQLELSVDIGKESRKKKRRQSLGRRVSFSNTINIRQFVNKGNAGSYVMETEAPMNHGKTVEKQHPQVLASIPIRTEQEELPKQEQLSHIEEDAPQVSNTEPEDMEVEVTKTDSPSKENVALQPESPPPSSGNLEESFMNTPDIKKFVSSIRRDQLDTSSCDDFDDPLGELTSSGRRRRRRSSTGTPSISRFITELRSEMPSSPLTSPSRLNLSVSSRLSMSPAIKSRYSLDADVPPTPSLSQYRRELQSETSENTATITPSLQRLLSRLLPPSEEMNHAPKRRESISDRTPELSRFVSKLRSTEFDMNDTIMSPGAILRRSMEEIEDTTANLSQLTFMKTPTLSKLVARVRSSQVDDSQNLSQMITENVTMETPTLGQLLASTQESDLVDDRNDFTLTSLPQLNREGLETPSLRQLLEDQSRTPDDQPDILRRILAVSPGEQRTIDILQATRKELTDSEINRRIRSRLPTPLKNEGQLRKINKNGPLNFQDFSELAGIHFLVSSSIDRKPSLSRNSYFARPKDHKELLKIASCDASESAVLQWGCENLKEIICRLQEENDNMELALSQNNPPVFHEVRNLEGTQLETIKNSLKKLKETSKKFAKQFWYSRQVDYRRALFERLSEHYDLLKEDAPKLKEYLDHVSKLREDLRADREQFLESKKELFPQTSSVQIIDQGSLGNEKKELLNALAGLQLWQLKSVTPGEATFHFEDKFALHLIIENRKQVIHRSFSAISGILLDDFWKAMYHTLDVNSILSQLTSTVQLREILHELNVRLGRINDLAKEMHRLNRSLTLRRKKAADGVQVEVEFPNVQRRSKFIVSFKMDASYPFGEIQYNFTNLFGTTQASDVDQLVQSVGPGFGRLTRLCQIIKNNL